MFSAIIPGVNDTAQLSATGGDCGLPTIGAVRVVLEPKPGLPTDPNDPRAFIDVFTDISPLFVINNESGWYEGWMIHDLTVSATAPPRRSGRAQFGTITAQDAMQLEAMGHHHNVMGAIFTLDGNDVRFPSKSDHFPEKQSNTVPIQESMGAYNSFQQSDSHSYWEFNYLGTNWIHPLYELPFTGGFPDDFGKAPDTFRGWRDRQVAIHRSRGRDPGVSTTWRPWWVTTLPCPATRTSSTGMSMRSANFVSAVFPADWRMRCTWMSTRDRPPSSQG